MGNLWNHTPTAGQLAVFPAEAWRSMALLSEKLRNRIRNQGRVAGHAAGLAKGLAEASLAWREWFARYEEARRKGEPFDEPFPDRR